MTKLDGVSAVALVLIASFAIDRIVRGLLFLLSFANAVPDPTLAEDETSRRAAEKKYRLMYFLFAGIIGIFVLAYYGNVRILAALGVQAHAVLDTVLTGIVLMGGAERLASFLKLAGEKPEVEKQEPQPIQITGRLTLEDSTLKKAAGQGD
jgi:hypothetical protein